MAACERKETDRHMRVRLSLQTFEPAASHIQRLDNIFASKDKLKFLQGVLDTRRTDIWGYFDYCQEFLTQSIMRYIQKYVTLFM